MIVSAHQPYFCPYPGYFSKIMHSDVFVILDSVQLPRGSTWVTRNRFKNDQGSFWMSIPVRRKGRGLQEINEARICHEGSWKRKHLESIKTAYCHAPWLEDHLPLFERAFSASYELVVDVDVEAIRHVASYLDLGARLMLLSEMDAKGKGTALLVSLCRKLGASGFLAFTAARKYLDESLFEDAGITVSYMSPPVIVYPQLWGDFVQNLSVFDLLFTCGRKARDIMAKGRAECSP